jgi:hypothetical protein
MEHLRVVVIPVAEVRTILDTLAERLDRLERLDVGIDATAVILRTKEARRTMQTAIDHPVHPPERHEEATL